MTLTPSAFELSQFLQNMQRRDPELFQNSSFFERAYSPQFLHEELTNISASISNLTELKKHFRVFRNRYMARIAYRDLTGLGKTTEILKELSSLADTLLTIGLDWLFKAFCERYGSPRGKASNELQRLIILGMGKLGGQELNFSSDIDLIYVFPEQGHTQGGPIELSNEIFFTRLAQALNQLLTERTIDGFVYRVDMRLRPFGQTGALVTHFSALSTYYQLHGRAWERYAALKARAITGSPRRIKELYQTILNPFIYRRYLDFSAMSALRELKKMIELDVEKKGHDQNIKLGRGGIREAEFVVQGFQLIYGGRHSELQGQSFFKSVAVNWAKWIHGNRRCRVIQRSLFIFKGS